MGRDNGAEFPIVLPTGFQSTRPAWGATLVFLLRIFSCGISIHAPRMGRDHCQASKYVQGQEFQSTRPAWGATTRLFQTICSGDYFNPRAPHGARL